MKIAINGAAGRMGRRLMALTQDNENCELVQAIEYDAHPLQGKVVRDFEPELDSDIILASELAAGADVLIDFTTPESTVAHCTKAIETNTALIVGTTGMTPEQEAVVKDAATKIPVIHAGNYSLGVNLIVRVAAEVAKALGEDFDIEISESHHNKKADAPSGTALMIAKSICDATSHDYEKDLVDGRTGRPGARTKSEIGMHALRLGSVVGDHTVYFGSDFERVELTHKAQTRDVFAAGAIRAAKWIAQKPAGMYTIDQVLFG